MPKGIYDRKGWKGNDTSFKIGQTPWNKGIKYEQITGDKSPTKRPEVKQKISEGIAKAMAAQWGNDKLNIKRITYPKRLVRAVNLTVDIDSVTPIIAEDSTMIDVSVKFPIFISNETLFSTEDIEKYLKRDIMARLHSIQDQLRKEST